MSIVIRKIDNTFVAEISKAISVNFSEKLTTEKTLSFSTILEGDLEDIKDNGQYIAIYDEDIYDVVSVEKKLESGQYVISFECEHVSYRLSEYTLTPRTIVGTPTEIISQLLGNSIFRPGTIEPTEREGCIISSNTTVRAALLEYCKEINHEISFNQFYVSVFNHRGSTQRKQLIDKNAISVSKKTDKIENTIGYTCTIRRPTSVKLGDEVRLKFEKLDIDVNVRVVGVSYDPFQNKEMTLEIDNYTPSVESQFLKIENSMVSKDKNYYGVVISDENGLIITRQDEKARIVINADTFKMQAKGENNQYVDRLYFDPNTNEYKFVGNVDIDGGEIKIGNNFRVDQNGNAFLGGDATIYGGKYYAGNPGNEEGYSQMTQNGFDVFNRQKQLKIKFGYTTDNGDFPFVQLGSGSGEETDYGLVKKFQDGLWLGNAIPENLNGAFQPGEGFNGIFFRFTDNSAFIVHNTEMKNIYTGASVAKFG